MCMYFRGSVYHRQQGGDREYSIITIVTDCVKKHRDRRQKNEVPAHLSTLFEKSAKIFTEI